MAADFFLGESLVGEDRKSTRLNSSHGYISYAVFCLKKKKKITRTPCGLTTVLVIDYPPLPLVSACLHIARVALRFLPTGQLCRRNTTRAARAHIEH